ncbi:MAG: PDGLE domain-containing protein [Planctomycetota bacterium]|nr:PDGLE domain-containing protein [Planctomycetota bacterium]
MHIPDGFLDVKTATATGVLAAAGLGLALRQARRHLPARRVPLLGLSAAFVFAAQMINFPVAGGTSGHLIGGVLTAALLGPSAALIVISAVLIVQCFLFADGGVTALGANLFNMALIGGVGGWVVYHLLSRGVKGLFGRLVAAVVAGWASTVLASIACAGELAGSGTVGWRSAWPAMAGTHMVIGIGEGVITALVLAAIAKVRPELLGLTAPGAGVLEGAGAVVCGEAATTSAEDPVVSRTWLRRRRKPRHPATNLVSAANGERTGPLVVFGLLMSVGLALFVAPFACGWPDGLDKTAETLGFKDRESEHRALPAPAPDYKTPGISSEALATAIAGAAGTVFVFALAWGLARALSPKSARPPHGRA